MKRAKRNFIDKPWKHFVVAVVALVAAYGAASWSIDSGRWLVYGLTLALTVFGIRELVRTFKKAHAK